MESMHDELLGKIARPYVRLAAMEQTLSRGLSPGELAALYIIRSLELLREGDDLAGASNRHEHLADELRAIMTAAAQESGESFRDILLSQAIIGTAQRIMDLKKPPTLQ